MRLPAILLLLMAGLILGPGVGALNPDLLLGDLLFPFVSVGVAIILFEGSLTLRFSDARNVTRIIRNLTSVGVLVTWVVMGAAAHYLAGLSWELSMLFGALASVTGPTVIIPMLRSIRPSARIANILRWEGILIDPIGAVLAVLVFEFLITGQQSESLFEFFKVIATGVVWGGAGGGALGLMLRKHAMPGFLQNYAALALVLFVFTASNEMGHESGLLAVTVMGIVVANMKDLDVSELLSFKEDLTVVLISVFFILLAARLDVELVAQVGTPSLLVLAVALFIARPLSVLVSSIGTSVNWREMALLSWVAPRGIVAAAVSSLFALKLAEKGIEEASVIVPLTFVLIIGTVVVQSLTAGWLAGKLGLSSRSEQGVLINSANRVGLALGEALKNNGIRVLVADVNREGLHEAKMKGLDVFYGNPLSEHADRYMDKTGLTHLMAVSRNNEANAMLCNHYRHEFGHRNVFSIETGTDRRTDLVTRLRANTLFRDKASWTKLASLIAKGAETRATPLTDEFNFDDFIEKRKGEAIPLFALDDNGVLKVFASGRELRPEPGWTVISLVNGRNHENGD
ncbi:MAG: sodium:proton antiporter [Xanthomonadales bacterium]|nr:sodium:proton antiporter [Xanthomonadales bacterium]